MYGKVFLADDCTCKLQEYSDLSLQQKEYCIWKNNQKITQFPIEKWYERLKGTQWQ